jgi:hypothetical protein
MKKASFHFTAKIKTKGHLYWIHDFFAPILAKKKQKTKKSSKN